MWYREVADYTDGDSNKMSVHGNARIRSTEHYYPAAGPMMMCGFGESA